MARKNTKGTTKTLTDEQIIALTNRICGDYDQATCEAILLLTDAIYRDQSGGVQFNVQKTAFAYIDSIREEYIAALRDHMTQKGASA
jgi:hypothetical protein